MRVNIDSQVATDARFKKLGRALGVNWHEALGRCIPVWLDSYQRRCELLSEEDIDITADRDGFARALVGAGLASDEPGGVRLHGVRDRIRFLVEQQTRSQKGLQARWGSHSVSEGRQGGVPAEHGGRGSQSAVSRQDCKAENIPIPNGIPNGKPNGIANGMPNGMPNGLPNSPDLDQAPDHDLKIRERARAIPRSPGVPSASLSLIPSGWEPEKSEENAAVENAAAAHGAKVSAELEQFRDRMRSAGKRSADWNAEWRSFVRRFKPRLETAPRTRTASGTPAPRRILPPAQIVARSPSEVAELSRMAAAAIEGLSYEGDDDA